MLSLIDKRVFSVHRGFREPIKQPAQATTGSVTAVRRRGSSLADATLLRKLQEAIVFLALPDAKIGLLCSGNDRAHLLFGIPLSTTW